MERSPNLDRSGAPDRRRQGSAQAPHEGAKQPDPGKPESSGEQAQQQSPRTRDFAPGEDGECH